MAKIKPIEQIADDVNKGDIIRILFKGKSENVGYFKKTTKIGSQTYFCHISKDFPPSYSGGTSFNYSKREGDNPHILGYEILRRAKKYLKTYWKDKLR